MITRHWFNVPSDINIHAIVDDFGTLHTDLPSARAWWNAYRFANVVSFEQAAMRSIGQAVSEH